MKQKIIIISILSALFLFLGCSVSSAYILTMEYTNPKTNRIQTIDIPVSQYEYNKTDVGASYEATIHTGPMGITIPVSNNTITRASMADMMPVIVLIAGFILTIYGIHKAKNIGDYIGILFVFVFTIGFYLLMTLPMQPEYTVIGTIINKDFVISSSY